MRYSLSSSVMSTCGDHSANFGPPFPFPNRGNVPPRKLPRRFCTSSSSLNGFHVTNVFMRNHYARCWTVTLHSLRESVQILCCVAQPGLKLRQESPTIRNHRLGLSAHGAIVINKHEH